MAAHFLYRFNPFRDSFGGGIRDGLSALLWPVGSLRVRLSVFSSVQGRSILVGSGSFLKCSDVSWLGLPIYSVFPVPGFSAGASPLFSWLAFRVIPFYDFASLLIFFFAHAVPFLFSGLFLISQIPARFPFPNSLWIAPACRCAWPMGTASFFLRIPVRMPVGREWLLASLGLLFFSSSSLRLYLTTSYSPCQHIFVRFGKFFSRSEMFVPPAFPGQTLYRRRKAVV